MLFLLARGRPSSGSSMVERIFYTRKGQIVVSIILGLGLTLLFHKTCKGNDCVIHEAPSLKSLEKYAYSLSVNGETKCYKYTPEYTPCVTTDATETK